MAGASYAKAQGKTVEDFARYFGEVAITTWDINKGIKGFINDTLLNWVTMTSSSSPAI